jgi:hypothetical protein
MPYCPRSFRLLIKDTMMTPRHLQVVSCRTLPRHTLSVAVLVALSGAPLFAFAQVTSDPNTGVHRPGIDAAADVPPLLSSATM